MSIGVNNCGDGDNRGPNEAVNNMVGISLLVLSILVELLHACGPFFMAVIMYLSLCLHEL
jgi:hypothetical protein